MPTYQYLTDRSLAQSTAITPTTIIHIVTTADTTQSVYGSSYKAELQQLLPVFSGANGTSGVDGTSGIDGTSGSSGTSGIDGTSGSSGSSGTSGTSGTSGSSGTSGTSGLTFSGGSGNCITDLYTSNIHSCSPLNINPLDEGNVYFGSTSAVTINTSNSGTTVQIKGHGTTSTGDTDDSNITFRVGDSNNKPLFAIRNNGSMGVLPPTGFGGLFIHDDVSLEVNGKTTDSTTRAFRVQDGNTNPIFQVRNDRRVSIGSDVFDNSALTIYRPAGTTYGLTVDGNVGIGTTTPTSRLSVSTTGSTTGTTPSFRFLDGVSTPTDTSTIKSFYKEFRPTTKTTSVVVGDGTFLYPNITSSSSADFYAKANLTLYTDNLSLLTSTEALKAETNVIQIQSTGGTYNGYTIGTTSILRNVTVGGTIDKYIGFWMNGFDVNYTHNGTTNNIYGFYMDSQSGRSGNIPATTNRYGVYIEDVGRNYFAGTVGIGTTTPTEKLEVNGKTKTTNFQMTSGATDGYVLTSDSNGNGTWQKPMGYQYYSAVTITSGQTLSIGSSPVEILPAPGVNKYYDFKVFFEYVFNTVAYSSTGTFQLVDNTTKRVTNQFDISGQLTNRVFVSDMNFQNQFTSLNSQIEFTTSNGSNPTLGDGSFKVKIYYNIIDFG